MVPALNEEAALPKTLGRLRDCGLEVIVVDGGSMDDTAAVAGKFGTVLTSPPGRARQMNLGASRVKTGLILFVHADSLPPLNAKKLIQQTLSRPGTSAGAFKLKIDSIDPKLRIISGLANLRSLLFSLPYGDQGLFLNREVFEKIGTFPDIPLMEDVELARRLKKLGRIRLAPGCVETSARRWEKTGPLTNSFRNLFRLLRYYAGASPQKLADEYRNVR